MPPAKPDSAEKIEVATGVKRRIKLKKAPEVAPPKRVIKLKKAPEMAAPKRKIKLSKAGLVAAKEAPKLAEISEKLRTSQAKKRILKILKAALARKVAKKAAILANIGKYMKEEAEGFITLLEQLIDKVRDARGDYFYVGTTYGEYVDTDKLKYDLYGGKGYQIAAFKEWLSSFERKTERGLVRAYTKVDEFENEVEPLEEMASRLQEWLTQYNKNGKTTLQTDTTIEDVGPYDSIMTDERMTSVDWEAWLPDFKIDIDSDAQFKDEDEDEDEPDYDYTLFVTLAPIEELEAVPEHTSKAPAAINAKDTKQRDSLQRAIAGLPTIQKIGKDFGSPVEEVKPLLEREFRSASRETSPEGKSYAALLLFLMNYIKDKKYLGQEELHRLLH